MLYRHKRISALFLTSLLITTLCFSSAYAASNDVSPALNLLREQTVLKKCGVVNCDLQLKITDFEKALGVKKLEKIVITSLPEPSDGVLKLAGIDVQTGQIIDREMASQLTFVPYPDKSSAAVFTFANFADSDDIPAVKCELNILPTLNFAPQVGNVSVTTQRNIAAFKMMQAADPDGDSLTYHVVALPKKGRVELSDPQTGLFVYTPVKSFTGKDSFEYVAMDAFGNVSKQAKVTVNVTKAASPIYYEDMERHYAHNSAIKLALNNIMPGTKEDGKDVFKPDERVTRAEFVAIAMRASGLDKGANAVYDTGFTDDADIPLELKGYIAKAAEMNIIKGVSTPSGVYFDPNNIITRSEAAVIINNILKSPTPDSAPTFADAAAIPTWASGSISALKAVGIIKGSPEGYVNPAGIVSRGEAAEMFCSMQEIIAGK